LTERELVIPREEEVAGSNPAIRRQSNVAQWIER